MLCINNSLKVAKLEKVFLELKDILIRYEQIHIKKEVII